MKDIKAWMTAAFTALLCVSLLVIAGYGSNGVLRFVFHGVTFLTFAVVVVDLRHDKRARMTLGELHRHHKATRQRTPVQQTLLYLASVVACGIAQKMLLGQ